MLKKNEITYKNFGRCLELSNDKVRLIATLDCGPRIIYFGALDGPNEFFEDTNDIINGSDNPEAFGVYGENSGWHIYGGHRLWVSPESLPRTYYPDNDPIQHELTETGVILTPPVQKWTNLQFQMILSVCGNEVSVQHKITNLGAWAIQFAPWSLTVMAAGGLEAVPQPQNPTGFLENRTIKLWPYTNMSDPRLSWGDRLILMEQDVNATEPCKFAINNQHGFAAYFNHDNLFIKRFDVDRNCAYVKNLTNYETYTNPFMLEMESVGVFMSVQPSETATHSEKWILITDVSRPDGNEVSVKKVLNEKADCGL